MMIKYKNAKVKFNLAKLTQIPVKNCFLFENDEIHGPVL